MNAPYVTTLEPDRSDDSPLTLTSEEARDELMAFWRSLSDRDANQYWRDCSDAEREAITAMEADVTAVRVGRLNAYRSAAGRKHLGNVA